MKNCMLTFERLLSVLSDIISPGDANDSGCINSDLDIPVTTGLHQDISAAS